VLFIVLIAANAMFEVNLNFSYFLLFLWRVWYLSLDVPISKRSFVLCDMINLIAAPENRRSAIISLISLERQHSSIIYFRYIVQRGGTAPYP
jgi:hypothetical protein